MISATDKEKPINIFMPYARQNGLVGFCLLDRITGQLQRVPGLRTYAWQRREIENYIVFNKQVLIEWARNKAFGHADGSCFPEHCVSTMEETIVEIEKARATLRQEPPWSPDIKVTDDFLDGFLKLS